MSPIEYPDAFRRDFRIPEQSERNVASFTVETGDTVGLERTTHDIIRFGLARNFSRCANRARGPGRDGGGRKYSRTRTEISGSRRSAHSKSGRSQLRPGTCRNLFTRRRTARWFRELSTPAI